MTKFQVKQQKQAFNLDAVQADAKGEAFIFIMDGEEFKLPPFGRLNWKVLKKVARGDMDAMDEALQAALGEQYEAFDQHELTVDGFMELFAAWSEHSGLSAGE